MVLDPIDEHVGKRLKLRRNILTLTQEALGKAIGVTFQQIQKYERGSNRIGPSRLFKLASCLGVDVGYFFEGLQEAYPIPAISPTLLAESAHSYESEALLNNKEVVTLVRAYHAIQDPHVRKQLVSLARTLAASIPFPLPASHDVESEDATASDK